jgi:hypothetical protein
MDWGFAAPYCVLWLAMDNDGNHYVWRELYGYGGKPNVGTREDASQVAERINKVEEHDERNGYEYRMCPADSQIFSEQGHQRTIAQLFRQKGVKWVDIVKGRRSRVNNAQVVVQLLKSGKLKFFRACKHSIRTIPALMPDDNNPEDVNTKMEDHPWDALLYGVASRRRPPDDEQKSEEDQNQMYKDSNDNHMIHVK